MLTRLVLLAAAGLFGLASAQGQLNWGVNGGGGTGTWNTTNLNWFDGTNNVAWNNGAAVFGGTAGTITAVPFLTVTAMTFNVAGYSVQSGYFLSPGNLTVTTNADATLNSTLSSNTSGATLVKNGTGTLTSAGTNFFANVQVNAGQYLSTSSSGLFFSNVTLANTPGVTLTFGSTSTTQNMAGLSGGGTAGGIVQPDSQARTVTVTNFGGGSFAGVVQDNGSGKLAYTQYGGPTAPQIFTGANTYSGATSASYGTLSLAGNGSILNSTSLTAAPGGTLQLDNSATALSDRIADTATVKLDNGTFRLTGNASTAVNEASGALQIAGGAAINVTQPGSAATTLRFGSFSRTGNATLGVTGSGGVGWTGLANGSNGIVAPYVTAGNEWAVVGTNGTIQPLAAYATNPATATASDHVKLANGGTTTLAATTTWNTLNVQNNSGATGVLDLGTGHTLTLAGAGLLTSGSSDSRIQNGTLAAGGELVVTNNAALTISSAIGETSSGTALTKSGPGTLTLTGNNIFTGNFNLTQGTVVASSDGNLGHGSTVVFGGGTLQAGASFSTDKGFGASASTSVGVVNTNGFNVTFNGPNAGAIQKTGAGILTLTNGTTGSTYTSQGGTLALPNALSGAVILGGGTLQAAGTLSQVSLQSASTLDIGGSGAGTLTIGTVATLGGTPTLTVNFGLGSTARDRLTFNGGQLLSLSSGSILFSIANLGGVATGTDYTLIQLPNGTLNLSASEFALSADSLANGYKGVFSVTSNAVLINFSAVPEPSDALLVALAGTIIAVVRRRRRL